jgi:hypothetical protein
LAGTAAGISNNCSEKRLVEEMHDRTLVCNDDADHRELRRETTKLNSEGAIILRSFFFRMSFLLSSPFDSAITARLGVFAV